MLSCDGIYGESGSLVGVPEKSKIIKLRDMAPNFGVYMPLVVIDRKECGTFEESKARWYMVKSLGLSLFLKSELWKSNS